MTRLALIFTTLIPFAGCALDDGPLATGDDEPAVLDDTPVDTSPHEIRSGRVTTARGELDIQYEMIDGRGIYQGDIVVEDRSLYVATRTDTNYRWVNAIIPYRINRGIYNDNALAVIDGAIAEWNRTTMMWFYPADDLPAGYTDFVYITGSANSGCNSKVGRQGTGMQTLNLGNGCFTTGTVLHEMGHAAGLWHEQSRADRDDNVIVHTDNIISDYWIHQYDTYVESGDDGQDLYDFDFASAMLYPSFASSIAKDPSKPIMTDLYNNVWGAPQTLSVNDISGITRFQTWPSTGRTYMLQFVHSGKCLDVEAASRVAGRNINQFQCHGNENQRFHSYTVPWQPSGRIVMSENSGQCLDITNGSTADGARLRQYPCAEAPANQRFDFLGDATAGYMLKARNSGLCLTVDNASTANGAWVRQRPCTGAANQRMKIVY